METARGKTREDIVNRLADKIDSFERYTQPHSRIIAELATRLARRLGLAHSDVDAIAEAAMLHDIGLYAMSPSYYLQSGPLTLEARMDLWRHPVIGEQQMAKREAMRHAQLLVRWHHEWWDGSGYPDMLAREDIPIGARILRAVELYCALVSDRPYRGAFDHEHAVEALASSAGIECDPYITKALLALLAELSEPTLESAAPAIETPPIATVTTLQARLVSEPVDIDQSPLAHSVPLWTEPAASDLESTQPSTEPGTETSAEVPDFVEPGATSSILTASPEPALALAENPPRRSSLTPLLTRLQSPDFSAPDSARWLGWRRSGYGAKTLLGFQASVLRQIEFRSIAIPFWSEVRLDWYLKAWGKLIYANDPRPWLGIMARANVEAAQPLGEELLSRILEDVYVPGVRLVNPDLRRWFSETDAWWMDNLRRNIDRLDDDVVRSQALALGLQTGDYALSFDDETRDLRRPLTTVFWRLAGRALSSPSGQPHNRSSSQRAEDFIRHARADVLFLRLPSTKAESQTELRSEWRDAWVSGAPRDATDKNVEQRVPPQSRQSYLASINRLLKPANQYRAWAIEYQETGLATAQDLVELIKEYRPVRATYSKDVTEVAGGLRSYIIVGESPPR